MDAGAAGATQGLMHASYLAVMWRTFIAIRTLYLAHVSFITRMLNIQDARIAGDVVPYTMK